MTSEVILSLIKNLRLYYGSIHRNLHQNLFIQKYARKKKRVQKSRSFLVRYKRPYVLKTIFFVSLFLRITLRKKRKVSISLPKIDYLGFTNNFEFELPFLLVNHDQHRIKVNLLNKERKF